MNVRIVTYIKNEQQYLERWLKHHLGIVPGWYIHVFDNNSTDDTKDILDHYKNKEGVRVTTHDNYLQKGEVVTQYIRKFENHPCVVLPVDGDEFVALYDGALTVEGEKIYDYLSRLPRIVGKYRTLGWLEAIPEAESYIDPIGEITKFKWAGTEIKDCKKFFYSNSFVSTDLGYHRGNCKDKSIQNTDICYLHYRNGGKKIFKQRCIQDIRGLGYDVDDINNLIKSQHNGIGSDKIKSFLQLNDIEYSETSDYDVEFHGFKSI
jgi:hypothetical protein